MYQVIKRDGKVVDFDISKISSAITKAFEAQGKQYHSSVIDLIALKVTADFEEKIVDDKISVEAIQDSVEKVLSESGYADVAKAYILYRRQREKVRNVNSALLNYKEIVDNYLKINDWRVKENATVTYSVGGLILSNSGAITANYWLSEVYDEDGAFILTAYNHPSLSSDYCRHVIGEAPEMPEEIKASFVPVELKRPVVKSVDELKKIAGSLF